MPPPNLLKFLPTFVKFDPANTAFPYLAYSCQTSFPKAEGLIQIPVAGGPAEIVRVHNPISQRVVRFFAVRMGVRPVLPSPTPRSGEAVYSTTVVIDDVRPGPDGAVPIYTVAGEYVFVNVTAVGAGNNLVAHYPPYLVTQPGHGVVTVNDFTG